MFWYIVRRLLLVIPTLIGVAVAVFFLIRVMPGDVVVVKLRADGAAISEETIQAERKRLGLDKPLHEQYLAWMGGVLQGDLGRSLWPKEPILEEFARLVAHLTERISGVGEDGQPRVFRDSAVGNLTEFFDRFRATRSGGK